jgi:hypothetical protein
MGLDPTLAGFGRKRLDERGHVRQDAAKLMPVYPVSRPVHPLDCIVAT